MTSPNTTNLTLALAATEAGVVTAKLTSALGTNNKELATMEAMQAGIRNVKSVVNGTTALVFADQGLILVDATSGNVTINLPAATVLARYEFRRIDTSANTATINRAGSDTIEGATSITLSNSGNHKHEIVSNGSTKWYSISQMDFGTFTPTARGTGTTGAFTYSAQSGQWQRAANRVQFNLNIQWSASTATGGLRIKLNDLPWLPAAAQQCAVALRIDALVVGSGKTHQAYVTATNNEIILEAADATGSATADIAADSVVGQIMISGSYLTV